MKKKERNYIFWARRSSDVDHTVPIIYSLIQHGVESEKIQYFIQAPHYSLKGIEDDPRIKFLIKKGVSLKTNSFFFIYSLFSSLPFSELKAKLDKILFRIYINSLVSKFTKDSLNVMDQSTAFENEYIVLKLKRKGIRTVAISHGLSLFNGVKDENEWKRFSSTQGENKLELFDLVVMPNTLHSSIHCKNLSEAKVKILGSPRYSEEWLFVLKRIYRKNKYSFQKKEKLNLLFLLEKQENYGFGLKYNFYPDLMQTLEYLDSHSKINLLLKAHPSMHPSEREAYSKIKSKVFLSDEVSTFELISQADLVVGSDTSCLSDAILEKKKVLIISFCSIFKTILNNYDLKGICYSFQDFSEKIERVLDFPKDKYLNEYNISSFKKEILGSNKTLENYYYLLSANQVDNELS